MEVAKSKVRGITSGLNLMGCVDYISSKVRICRVMMASSPRTDPKLLSRANIQELLIAFSL